MTDTHWIFRRINLPDWAVKIVARYAERYHKSAAEVTREALCVLAAKVVDEEAEKEELSNGND